MSLEILKNIGDHIETENKTENDKTLFKRIEQISLFYADKKFQEIRKDNDDYKFSEAVKNFMPIKNILLKPVFQVEEFNFKNYQEKIDLFLKDFYDEVDSIYNAGGFYLDNISKLIDLKRGAIKGYLEVADFKELESNIKTSGTKVLDFNEINNIEMNAEAEYRDLEKLGFSKSDHFIEIHVENFYNTGEKNLGPELIKSDLGVVAEYIIDKKPETTAVIGRSWLLNTPLADRLGFKKIEDSATEQNDFSTWLQFIDRNGQIDKKRFNEFLENGRIPYPSVKAYMAVEQFLKRYLPENRRGRIKLKEINKDRQDFWDRVQNNVQLMKIDWGELLKNDSDFESFVENNQTLNVLLNLISPDDKRNYLNFLRTMYNSNIPWDEFFKHKSKDVEDIDEKIDKVMAADLYKDKEVVIE